MAEIGWLIEETATSPIVVDERARVERRDIRGDISVADLTDDLLLFLSDLEVVTPCSIELTGELPGEWIDIHFLPRGEAVLHTQGGKGRLDGRNGAVFRLEERRGRFDLPAAGPVRSVGLSVSRDRLATLLGAEMPRALDRMLSGASHGEVLPFRVGTPLRRLGASLFSTKPPQVLRRLYLEAQALQFIALALAELPSEAEPAADIGRTLSAREAKLVAEAHQRLEAELQAPPGITVLAAELGLSASRLGEGLKILYGATAFEIVRNARLDHARQVLETTEMPLKVLAFRVGYSDVTNFIHAFRGRFGCPPGRYAKARGGGEPGQARATAAASAPKRL